MGSFLIKTNMEKTLKIYIIVPTFQLAYSSLHQGIHKHLATLLYSLCCDRFMGWSQGVCPGQRLSHVALAVVLTFVLPGV